jgi:DNA polymerase (family 10)
MVSIEINAHPSRLDLDWRYLRRARDKGMKIPIDPDAHNIAGLDVMRYGVYIARKGWLTADDVLNAFSLDRLLRYFQEQRNVH